MIGCQPTTWRGPLERSPRCRAVQRSA